MWLKIREEYRLEVVFSSLRWPIWLGPLVSGYLPNDLRTNGGGDPYLSVYPLPERGLFRHFYSAAVYRADPAATTYTLEFGEEHAVVYSVALKEVDAP